jgi:hypothetical protein
MPNASKVKSSPDKQQLVKTIRNTAFTVLALGLVSFGVSWNEQVARTREPVAIGPAVLAQIGDNLSQQSDFPLHLELSRTVVRLGQFQVVTIQTRPFADLEIVTSDPTGNSNRPETFTATASETGQYKFRFKLDNFRELGQFVISARATTGPQQAYAQGTFVLQTWHEEPKVDEVFFHPLVP